MGEADGAAKVLPCAQGDARVIARRKDRSARARASAVSLALEPHVRLAVQRFVKVLSRCGCAPRALVHEVSRTCRMIPGSRRHQADLRDSPDLGHVMTLWFSDPNCLDERGSPRALPLRGAGLSIEALARQVDSELDVREFLRFLIRGGAVKRVGRLYVPRDRVTIHRGRESMTPFLRGLFGLLKTLEYNSRRGRSARGRLELYSRNPRFPASAIEAFDKRIRHLAHPVLVQIDADMHQRERARRKGERTVRMGVGIYRFEEDAPPRSVSRARRRGPRRGRT
jgi:Family of unknown function (DUF6502)